MKNSYDYNPKSMQIESKSDLCAFCNTNSANNPEYYVLESLYRVNKVENYLVVKTIGYNKMHILLKRCNICKDVQQKSNIIAFFVILVFLLLSNFLVYKYSNILFSILLCTISVGFLYPLTILLSGSLSKRKNAPRSFKVLFNINIIKDLKLLGFTPVKPSRYNN